MPQDGETKVPENRVAIVPLPQDYLIYLLEGRFELRGFPDDARVLGVNANWVDRSVDMLVESQSFPPVPQGMTPPRLGPFGAPLQSHRVETVQEGDRTLHFYVSENAERIESADGKVKFREFL